MRERKLYLFLSGLAAVRECGHLLEIALPRVPGHVYRAGSWLMETTIAEGSRLILNGVAPGSESFRGKDFTIRLSGVSLTSAGRAATLFVPRPRQILGLLRAVPVHGGPLVVSADRRLKFKSVATVVVLVFDYLNETDVRLEDHPWLPYSVDGSISLHIHAASELPETKQHEIDTGAALGTLISGYPGFKFEAALQPDWRWTPSRQYGDLGGLVPRGDHFVTPQGQFAFAQAQLEPYASRVQRMGLLGRLYQQGRQPALAWTLPAPVGMETSNCVMYHCR